MQALTSSRSFLANVYAGAQSFYDRVMGQRFELPAPFVKDSLDVSRYEVQGSYFEDSWTITFTNAPNQIETMHGNQVSRPLGCALAIMTGAAKTLDITTYSVLAFNGAKTFTTTEMFAEARHLMRDPDVAGSCEYGRNIIGKQEKKAQRIAAYRRTHPRQHFAFH